MRKRLLIGSLLILLGIFLWMIAEWMTVGTDFAESGTLVIRALLSVLVLAAAWMIIGAVLYSTYQLLGAPLRQRERGELFLNVLESGLAAGQSPERSVVNLAVSRDKSLGVRFHLLAAHIENGLTLGQALERVPLFLPAVCTATLGVGERLGEIRKVLPACRQWLDDAGSRVTGGVNFLCAALLLLSPPAVGAGTFCIITVFPKFQDIVRDLGGGDVPPIWRFAVTYHRPIVFLQLLIQLLFLLAIVVYAAGPRLVLWFKPVLLPVADRLAWVLPWKRKRLLRGFSSTLAALLDASLSESEAVTLAAASVVSNK